MNLIAEMVCDGLRCVPACVPHDLMVVHTKAQKGWTRGIIWITRISFSQRRVLRVGAATAAPRRQATSLKQDRGLGECGRPGGASGRSAGRAAFRKLKAVVEAFTPVLRWEKTKDAQTFHYSDTSEWMRSRTASPQNRSRTCAC